VSRRLLDAAETLPQPKSLTLSSICQAAPYVVGWLPFKLHTLLLADHWFPSCNREHAAEGWAGNHHKLCCGVTPGL
jgi:hypothetical protein